MKKYQKDQKNYLTQDNNVTCHYLLSNGTQRDVSSLLLTSEGRPWLSSSSTDFPHLLTLNLSSAKEHPPFYRAFGLSCWHAYPSNPSILKLHISADGSNFVQWQTIHTKLQAGMQVFKMREKIRGGDVKALRLEITKAHGGTKTYIN